MSVMESWVPLKGGRCDAASASLRGGASSSSSLAWLHDDVTAEVWHRAAAARGPAVRVDAAMLVRGAADRDRDHDEPAATVRGREPQKRARARPEGPGRTP